MAQCKALMGMAVKVHTQ